MTQQEDPPKPKPPEDMFGYIGKATPRALVGEREQNNDTHTTATNY